MFSNRSADCAAMRAAGTAKTADSQQLVGHLIVGQGCTAAACASGLCAAAQQQAAGCGMSLACCQSGKRRAAQCFIDVQEDYHRQHQPLSSAAPISSVDSNKPLVAAVGPSPQ